MRALTLHAPWAWLVPDPKSIETRSWGTRHRGWLAIHCSSAYPKHAKEAARQPMIYRALSTLFESRARPTGAIVAVVRLIGCIPTNLFNVPNRERPFGDYSPDRYAWILNHGMRLREPVPCPGKQGLWEVPDDVLETIRAQWKEARAKRTPTEGVIQHDT